MPQVSACLCFDGQAPQAAEFNCGSFPHSRTVGASIGPLDHCDVAVAVQIHAVLMAAHAQEAVWLQVRKFAPLSRTVADIQAETGLYLGAFADGHLAGALAFAPDDGEPGQYLVSALVVHPSQQRRGIARALLQQALRLGAGEAFAVATGASNAAALALYRSLGFVEYRRGTIGPQALPLVKLRRPRTIEA